MDIRKKVLILIDSLTCGGAEKSLVSLLPFISERYDITLMVIKLGGIFTKYVHSNVKIRQLQIKSNRFRKYLYSIALRTPILKKRHSAELYWMTIGKYLPSLKEKFDVAIAYQQGFPTFYIAEKVSADKKLCWINVDLNSAGYRTDFCRDFYRKFDSISAVSDILRDKVVIPNYCSDKNKVTTCWDILNEDFIRKMAKEYVPFERKNGELQITTVGRLVESKGYDLAIKAARRLKKKGIVFKWHFVGGGLIMESLRELAKQNGVIDNIIFHGEQVNPYPYISECDIYVQPSRHEGFGMTIGEAKILNKPIVGTNFPVIHNQLINRENGLIVDITADGIANGIIELVENEDLRTTIVSNVSREINYTAITESKKVIELIEA